MRKMNTNLTLLIKGLTGGFLAIVIFGKVAFAEKENQPAIAENLATLSSRITNVEIQNHEVKQILAKLQQEIGNLKNSMDDVRSELNFYNLYGISQDVKNLEMSMHGVRSELSALYGTTLDVKKIHQLLGSLDNRLSSIEDLLGLGQNIEKQNPVSDPDNDVLE